MANNFITPSQVVGYAPLAVQKKMVVGNLVNRNWEDSYKASKAGDTVTVKTPANLGEATDISGSSSMSATDVNETSVNLKLEKDLAVRIKMTSKVRSLEVEDFTRQVAVPAYEAIVKKAEKYILNVGAEEWANLYAGSAGTNPDTYVDFIKAEKQIFDAEGNVENLIGLIGSSAYTDLKQEDQFTNIDYGASPETLRGAELGKIQNCKIYRSPYIDYISPGETTGDIGGSAKVKGATSAGATSITLDGLSTASGTLKKGKIFSVNDASSSGSTSYAVAADATISSNEVTITLDKPIQYNISDNADTADTSQHTADMVYNPSAFGCAFVPTESGLPGEVSATHGGIGITITPVQTDIKDCSWIFHTSVGARVLNWRHGAIVQS